jgi:hypothetical protein
LPSRGLIELVPLSADERFAAAESLKDLLGNSPHSKKR